MIDLSTLPLLKGKKALVAGIANDQSIAYGCAKALREAKNTAQITATRRHSGVNAAMMQKVDMPR